MVLQVDAGAMHQAGYEWTIERKNQMPLTIDGQPFFCSWSGGKDSALALHTAIQQGGKPRCLLTMLEETGARSRSHGLPRTIIEEQAKRLGLPVIFRSATWNEYEHEFISALQEIKEMDIHIGVFGDIDVESNREWVCRTCAAADMEPYHPLWQRPRRELLEEFMRLGFEAKVVVVNERLLEPSFLGRSIEPSTIVDMEAAGIDPSGEMGEYHTMVIDGPIFSSAVLFREEGRVVHDGYWFFLVDGGQPPAT